jgi:DNA-binding CsgD family transcriptional regulator
MSDVIDLDATLDSAERDEQILKLRVACYSVRDIAKRFGMTISTVNSAIDRAVGVIDNKLRARTVAVDLEMLNLLQKPFLLQAMKGDVQSAAILLKIVDRKSCYLGLDAPMKLDIIQQQQIGAPQTSTEEWLTAINRLVGTPPEPSEQSH